jgi:hypothetical protein
MSLALGEGGYCRGCVLREVCGDRAGPRACQPIYGEAHYGGVNVVHPARHDFVDYFAEIGGAGFESIRAIPVALPPLRLTMPRIYPRREFDGELRGQFYALGADEAIMARRQVLGADEMREMTGLWSDQRLALMLYGKDVHLEQIWSRRHQIISEIAECGYDFVAPPSYSALINHPPSEALRNLKRSLHLFELLQEAGVPTAPRLAWLSEHDARRAARWCEENNVVQLVTLDLAIKHQTEWRRQLSLLRFFDLLTGQRLKFLIHGPQAESRLIELFSFLGDRLHLSGSRAISKPRVSAQEYVRFTREEEATAYRALFRASSMKVEKMIPGATRPTNRVLNVNEGSAQAFAA